MTEFSAGDYHWNTSERRSDMGKIRQTMRFKRRKADSATESKAETPETAELPQGSAVGESGQEAHKGYTKVKVYAGY